VLLFYTKAQDGATSLAVFPTLINLRANRRYRYFGVTLTSTSNLRRRKTSLLKATDKDHTSSDQEDADPAMAGTTKYLRYIVFAFVVRIHLA